MASRDVKFRIRCRYADGTGEPWWENYEKPGVTSLKEAEEWAEATIDSFNSTLRPHERARKLLAVELLPDDTDVKRFVSHNWEKTNLITKASRGMSFDEMECKNCGATGRRYGLGQNGVEMSARSMRKRNHRECINKAVWETMK